ncbi:sugar ABC transporter ATP-binding protein [Gracilibacillus alcaliphilus]|uniref:sugar ABC transporter ATP-binding protein n=1 Tax=Gracilibacillus alcaliphilus TaxID=1401441 RepID=UPI001EF816E6|nr:sugar ABC transporter ATP-binding protein [Gracilibacillus alcaliphilus]MBM7677012.1 simple sugar transport system ATP-binding protein [Gracilibacillus alcaliphilus]
MTLAETALQMHNITIDFPGVRALDNAQFAMDTGRVHALIGANGAGKSTLMKVLSGAYSHYTGEILLDGQPVDIRSPQKSKGLGIQIVYQEVDTALIPYLTVGENIMLNHMVNEMGRKQLIRYSAIHQQAKKLLDRLNIQVSSRSLVSSLTLAEKQMVLIARAISTDCRFLILDEPTAPLSMTETERLFDIVRQLRDNNVGVIFISHRLQELFEICDDITVMRNGRFISQNNISEVTINDIVEKMLGKQLDEQFPVIDREIHQTIFEVEHLCDDEKVEDVTFHVHAGEVIGLAGLVGAGKTEICKALFGQANHVRGKVKLHGKPLNIRTPHQAVKSGLALVPEERRKEGILVDENVRTNLTAANLGSFVRVLSFLDFKKEKEASHKVVKDLDVKTPSIETKLAYLSGGNQQKIAIGKWLIADADVYIFDEPTKGVDVGSKKDIFTLILELAKRGKAIIYASSELAEIIGITDRTYLIYDGKVVKEVETRKTTEEELLFYSTGGRDS